MILGGPLRVWRLAWRKPTAFAAFTAGSGAGRFNPPGEGIIYTSTTLPLAVLEILAHWDDYHNFEGYGVYTADLSDALSPDPAGRPVLETLPEGFPLTDVDACRAYGSAWLGDPEHRSVALSVPSVLLPGVSPERNILLNPNHPHYDGLSRTFTAHGPFTLDGRIDNALIRP